MCVHLQCVVGRACGPAGWWFLHALIVNASGHPIQGTYYLCHDPVRLNFVFYKLVLFWRVGYLGGTVGWCVSYRFTRLMRYVCGLQFADLLGDRSSVSSLTYRVNLIGFIGVLGSCVRLVGSDCLNCGVA